MSTNTRADFVLEENLKCIRKLIWMYFWLLIFEGALRKWIAPSLSAPLLIVRDPILMGIYYFVFQAKIFPWNSWLIFWFVISSLSVFFGIFAENNNVYVLLYGFRVNFLHFPLIFIMGQIFNYDDVTEFGRAILILALPIGFVMMFQFLSPPDAFINATAGSEGFQIAATEGNVRPPGPFTYITGAAEYISLAAAFLMFGNLSESKYSWNLLWISGVGLALSLIVCISRLALSYVLFVCIAAFLICIMKPAQIRNLILLFVIAILVFTVVLQFDAAQHGLNTFSERITNAGEAEGGSKGTLSRALNDYTQVFDLLWSTPLMGAGLGMGTSAGARLITGESIFLLAEGDWARMVLESGPIIGMLIILWRVAIAVFLFKISIDSFQKNNILPALIFSSVFQLVLVGQISRPTTLGFTVFGAGLCLAASNRSTEEEDFGENE